MGSHGLVAIPLCNPPPLSIHFFSFLSHIFPRLASSPKPPMLFFQTFFSMFNTLTHIYRPKTKIMQWKLTHNTRTRPGSQVIGCCCCWIFINPPCQFLWYYGIEYPPGNGCHAHCLTHPCHPWYKYQEGSHSPLCW